MTCLSDEMRMSFYWLVLGSLAVWRVTHLLTTEAGPWEILLRLRHLMAGAFSATLVGCFYCLSLWIALPFAYFLGSGWRERGLLWLALSGAAILLERITS